MTNIYKVPCYIEFEVDGELVHGSLSRMTEVLLSNLVANKRTLNKLAKTIEATDLENPGQITCNVLIKQYELPKEFIKAVISLL